jgi:hypothetical protein
MSTQRERVPDLSSYMGRPEDIFKRREPLIGVAFDKGGGPRPPFGRRGVERFLSTGAGDGNRTHDIQLGKLTFYL